MNLDEARITANRLNSHLPGTDSRDEFNCWLDVISKAQKHENSTNNV